MKPLQTRLQERVMFWRRCQARSDQEIVSDIHAKNAQLDEEAIAEIQRLEDEITRLKGL